MYINYYLATIAKTTTMFLCLRVFITVVTLVVTESLHTTLKKYYRSMSRNLEKCNANSVGKSLEVFQIIPQDVIGSIKWEHIY